MKFIPIEETQPVHVKLYVTHLKAQSAVLESDPSAGEAKRVESSRWLATQAVTETLSSWRYDISMSNTTPSPIIFQRAKIEGSQSQVFWARLHKFPASMTFVLHVRWVCGLPEARMKAAVGALEQRMGAWAT